MKNVLGHSYCCSYHDWLLFHLGLGFHFSFHISWWSWNHPWKMGNVLHLWPHDNSRTNCGYFVYAWFNSVLCLDLVLCLWYHLFVNKKRERESDGVHSLLQRGSVSHRYHQSRHRTRCDWKNVSTRSSRGYCSWCRRFCGWHNWIVPLQRVSKRFYSWPWLLRYWKRTSVLLTQGLRPLGFFFFYLLTTVNFVPDPIVKILWIKIFLSELLILWYNIFSKKRERIKNVRRHRHRNHLHRNRCCCSCLQRWQDWRLARLCARTRFELERLKW